MDETTHLGAAQDDLHNAARHVSKAANALIDRNSGFGGERVDKLTQALLLINYAFALTRSAVNAFPNEPRVRTHLALKGFITEVTADGTSPLRIPLEDAMILSRQAALKRPEFLPGGDVTIEPG